MKYFKLLFLGVVISAVAIACGNNAHDHDHSNGESTEMHEGHDHDGDAMHENGDADASQEPHGDGPEYTSAYVCPMHCEGSGSDQPGKCPKCGMEYVANADHMKDGHKH
ncbi:MAG: hypothetical protein Kow0027_24910 [Saprospiraceae bacterium]